MIEPFIGIAAENFLMTFLKRVEAWQQIKDVTAAAEEEDLIKRVSQLYDETTHSPKYKDVAQLMYELLPFLSKLKEKERTPKSEIQNFIKRVSELKDETEYTHRENLMQDLLDFLKEKEQ